MAQEEYSEKKCDHNFVGNYTTAIWCPYCLYLDNKAYNMVLCKLCNSLICAMCQTKISESEYERFSKIQWSLRKYLDKYNFKILNFELDIITLYNKDVETTLIVQLTEEDGKVIEDTICINNFDLKKLAAL